jgi:uncharacterized protein YdhG (YjbR/CyaY superfamily)
MSTLPRSRRRGVLERARSAIRKALPQAQEVISYKIPAYKLDGGVVIYFAGWTRHYSLYPVTKELIEPFKDDLGQYEFTNGTMRLPLSEPVPEKLIGRIAKLRAKAVAEREKVKATTAPKKR